jgi:DDE superfamily endonuclease.
MLVSGGIQGRYICLTDRMLLLKGQSCHGVKNVRENNSAAVCANSDGSDKWMLIVVGKSLKLHCFKNIKKASCEILHK